MMPVVEVAVVRTGVAVAVAVVGEVGEAAGTWIGAGV